MNLKKILVSSVLLAGIAVSPHALAAQSFDGHTVNVAFEYWDSNDLSNVLARTTQKDVLASDWAYHDEKDFDAFSSELDFSDWDIDFHQNRIELVYVSIQADHPHYEYQHPWPAGFHFQDIHNSLPEIINVFVNSAVAPFGFDPDLVTFDADNIYVNLNG
ncbi:hypothetical protein BHECKSOX_476 [Bathymodiolus heckerae thiotrophic gill symbiont]|uniref:hypothetical protein n=1 Tax=Bathymodiolus heckerae thiotrophic gill symbiont TaxID=1052212 RepID=UPI0010AFE562|nr:hypothetical protein [Bathymodiolus heckerae thiotrophic gill symbiont]SHN93560.1 hypothetical protein BHECKSOX_476 [Bathymodiolus heckerae thiotrophic gill symbiont]